VRKLCFPLFARILVCGRFSSAATINNSTLSNNEASSAGGVLNNDSTLTISNSTLSGNTADLGGGLLNFGRMTLNHNLIGGNIANYDGSEVLHAGGAITADNYNLFGHSGIDNATALLGFTPGVTDITATSDGILPTALSDILDTVLGDNDGRSSGSETATHALVPGSPAIDAAPSADCQAGTPADGVDQRGKPRNVNGDGRASKKECDIGAFEWQVADAAVLFQFLPFFAR
jgi:hypothetical protein